MKKKLTLIGFGIVIIIGLLFWEAFGTGQFQSTEEERYVSDMDSKVTRAELAKMISLLAYTREELDGLERVIIYEDTTKDKWYDKYINGIYTMGLLSEEESQENKYQPMGYLTFGQLKKMLDHVLIQKNLEEQDMTLLSEELFGKLEEIQGFQSDKAYVTKNKWLELYELLYKKVYTSKLEKKQLYILEVWENVETMEKWKIGSDKGDFYGDGLNLTIYKDKKVEVLCKGSQIVCVINPLQEETVLSNVWIEKQEEGQLHIFINGYKKAYSLGGELEQDLSSSVADITIVEQTILKVAVKLDVITGRVLLTTDNYIEIEDYGKVKLADNFWIYKVYDELKIEPIKAILVGYANTEFVLEDDKICAAIIKEPIEAENIRVLIKTENFANMVHDTVTVTSDEDFFISYGKEKKEYTKGAKVTINPNSDLMEKGRISIKSEKEEGKITILSINRNGISPSYRGTLEIALKEEELIVVNELSIEEYLYAVIPSEMPTSYGTESLKVQAICARSYAYKQLMANSCSDYGAHVDDSYSYQVYNNIPENEVSIEAVKETYGKVLQYNNEIITAYYFSTSCGHTANAHEVWNSTQEVPYLIGALQSEQTVENLDLTDENTFKAFITEDNYESYEKELAWYRWNVTMSMEDLKDSIDKNLNARYKANPKLIQTLQKDGTYVSVPVDTVGKVKEIEITERKLGGIITEIIIKGSKRTIKVMTEYNIRTLLAPIDSTIVRQDESKVEGLSMLPSAFFVLEAIEKDGKLSEYQITGGGYGHGVGMSQNGAKVLVDKGKTYEEVLKHFYQGVEIGVIYNE